MLCWRPEDLSSPPDNYVMTLESHLEKVHSLDRGRLGISSDQMKMVWGWLSGKGFITAEELKEDSRRSTTWCTEFRRPLDVSFLWTGWPTSWSKQSNLRGSVTAPESAPFAKRWQGTTEKNESIRGLRREGSMELRSGVYSRFLDYLETSLARDFEPILEVVCCRVKI